MGVPVRKEENLNNIIPLRVIEGKSNSKKKEVKLKKDGTIKKVVNNKVAGESSEVYAFKTKEEIQAMINVLNKHIEEAENECNRQIACRNKMMFIVGINLGIRSSDLHSLTYEFFYNIEDGNLVFKDFYTLQPMKQRKQKKFVKLFFNQAVKTAINDYVSEYPFNSLDDYLFPSRKGNGAIQAETIYKVVKDTAAEANLKLNYGSHSLRKTFGFWAWHSAEDKEKILIMLMAIFNHSSIATTKKYIGILDEEIEDVFNSLNIGLDMI
jgi:integrase